MIESVSGGEMQLVGFNIFNIGLYLFSLFIFFKQTTIQKQKLIKHQCVHIQITDMSQMVRNQFLILTRAGFSTPSIASITDAVIASHDVLTLRIRVTCVGLQITLIDVYKVKASHFKYELKNQVSHIHVVLSVVWVKI